MACNTERRHLTAGDWQPYRLSSQASRLRRMEEGLAGRSERHCGNVAVIRQELESEHGVLSGLRSVQRVVEPLRRLMQAEARATVRQTRPNAIAASPTHRV